MNHTGGETLKRRKRQGRVGGAAFCRRADAYLQECEDAKRPVTIGGFCLATELPLDTLKAWTAAQRRGQAADDSRTSAVAERLEAFWTRYFAAAEAALDEKDSFNASKFKLERLLPFFENGEKEAADMAEREGIFVTFDSSVEPYSR